MESHKNAIPVLLLTGLCLLAGCSSQDFGRPIGSLGDIVDSGKAYIEDDEDEAARRRAEQLSQALTVWQRQRADAIEDYNVGAEDVIEISILSLEAPETTTTITRTIRKDGTVTLPLVGAVDASGRTIGELQRHIIAAYEGGFLRDPQINVTITEYRSAPVVVTGAVQRPGIYYLRHNTSTVLEILSMANGLADAAGADLIIVRKRTAPEGETNAPVALVEEPAADTNGVDDAALLAAAIAALELEEPPEDAHRNTAVPGTVLTNLAAEAGTLEPLSTNLAAEAGETNTVAAADPATELITVDLERLLDHGDARLNLQIHSGDIVTVPPGREEFIYVLGYVQRPGSFELKKRDRVRALQAVAMAGGLSASARAQNSYLIIDKPSGRKVVSLDLTKIARGTRPPVYMEAGNTLVVGSGMLAKLAEFIKPSVGASASLAPVP